MRSLTLILLLVAAVAGAVLAWDMFGGGDQNELRQARRGAPVTTDGDVRAMARQAIENRLRLAPEHRAFFASYRHAFAPEFERLVTSFVQRAVDAGRLDPPERYLAETVRALRKSHGLLAAKADGERLEQLFGAQHRIVDTLGRTDAQMCVDFLYGHATQRFYDFSARNRALVSRLAQATLDAVLDGRERQIQRAAPTASDFTLLESALREQGLAQPEIEALLDGKAPEPPLTEAALCRAGRLYLETLRSLPDEPRMRIYGLAVEVLARS